MQVAALYVDQLGPYPTLDGVEWYGEERDARTYSGPHPIVAHPPCGPWGRLFRFCTKQDKSLAPLAVEQLQQHGGVLEHPAGSRLWAHMDLPRPGEFPKRGLWSVEVDQCRWGHRARKATWLLFSRIDPGTLGPLPPWQEPTHAVDTSSRSKTRLLKMSALERRRTPVPFAQFLVGLARATT